MFLRIYAMFYQVSVMFLQVSVIFYKFALFGLEGTFCFLHAWHVMQYCELRYEHSTKFYSRFTGVITNLLNIVILSRTTKQAFHKIFLAMAVADLVVRDMIPAVLKPNLDIDTCTALQSTAGSSNCLIYQQHKYNELLHNRIWKDVEGMMYNSLSA